MILNPPAGTSPDYSRSADFSILEAGLVAALALNVSDRVAVTIKVDGGAGPISPDPTKFATDPGAGGAVIAPTVGGGAGIEYFTLLNDFTVGIDLRFAMTLLSGYPIPSASATIPVKYTF
jgi:hypothetical protein